MTSLSELLNVAKSRGASDVLLMVGDAPALRVAGLWVRLECSPLGVSNLQSLAQELLRPSAWDELAVKRELDFSCSLPGAGRVRCNVHYQRDHLAIVLRLVWPEIPDARRLGIPPHAMRMGECPHGLILVSGPTGSGKSTTLAAIVEHINRERASHIITIEDPIEFIYTNKRAIIEQREIGSDTPSWQSALRTVLRQSPDVIVLGELRDLESIGIALAAAETGHLVMASVHSSTATGAISRMVDGFPAAQAAQVRLQLSQSLRMVFAQRLLPGRSRENRVLTYEILTGTPAIANMIRSNELEQIQNAISAGREHGMISFLQSGRELIARGLLDADTRI
ncbi:MAG TPA: PilT/PilU family type 4a pilus ATPase [Phycisphaerae bacterium]|nr:PilT/PilU family type 4a pilus ATPase [Phycisphaerae bacterium]